MPTNPMHEHERRNQLLTGIQDLCHNHRIQLPVVHILHGQESNNGSLKNCLLNLQQDFINAGFSVPAHPGVLSGAQDKVVCVLSPKWAEELTQGGFLYQACQRALAHANGLKGQGPGLWMLWHSGALPDTVPEGLEGLLDYYQGHLPFSAFPYDDAFFGTYEHPNRGLIPQLLGLTGEALQAYQEQLLKEYEHPTLPGELRFRVDEIQGVMSALEDGVAHNRQALTSLSDRQQDIEAAMQQWGVVAKNGPTPFPFPRWHLKSPEVHFTGRKGLLEELVTRINTTISHPTAISRVALTAVAGMGGVGKTTIARQLAHDSRLEAKFVAWFEAEHPADLANQYRALGRAKGIGFCGENDPPEAVVNQFKAWCQANPGWLLIYDNAEEVEAVYEAMPDQGGQVLITSRQQSWDDYAEVRNVNVLPEEEAKALLIKLSGREDTEHQAEAVVDRLGCLPLAIKAAGAYIKRVLKKIPSPYQKYLSELDKTQYRVLSSAKLFTHKQEQTIATVWESSWQALKAQAQEYNEPTYARALLTACSYLGEHIPRKGLEAWLAKLRASEGNRPMATPPESLLEIVLGQCDAYSLINLEKDSFSFHRLQQQVLRAEHQQ